MKKLVVLKLDGGLEQGVRVALEIGEEGERPNIEVTGQLPGATDLVTAVEQWQSTYSGSQIDEVQQQQSANNSQGLVGYLSYSRTAIS
jgi:hypothetical protein